MADAGIAVTKIMPVSVTHQIRAGIAVTKTIPVTVTHQIRAGIAVTKIISVIVPFPRARDKVCRIFGLV